MRLLFIRFLLIAYLITSNLSLSLAKEFKYDVRAYNLKVMEINFNINDEINNKITFNAEAVGIVGFFVKVFARSTVEFDNKDKNFWSYEYRYDKPTTNKFRLNKIRFSKEKVLSFETDPPRTEDLTKKIPYNKEDYFGVIDPIFAVKKLFLIDKKNLDCNKRIKVFDGNIFYYLVMKKENDQIELDSIFSDYKGKLQRCTLVYEPISGYIPGDPNTPEQFKVDLYFGIVGDNYFPIYATTKGKKGIRLKMYLNVIN
jgi:hypothetical protein